MGNMDMMRGETPTRGLPIVSPANMIPVQVIHREIVAPGVVTVHIVLPGAQQAPAPYLPGQFVTLALPTPRETLYRSYSLCGDGDAGQPWSLTIKRLERGAVSTYFYTHVNVGMLLYSSLARGTFTLPSHLRPEMYLVMVAAGSGITPIMGMLRYIAKLPPDEQPLVQLHYASKSEDDIIFGGELANLDREGLWLRQSHYLSTEGDRMTAEAIISRAGAPGRKAHWYVCGPDSLKSNLHKQLGALGVPAERVHAEVFATAAGPAYRVEARGGAGVGGQVHIAETGADLEVQPQETLLTALERHGYRPDFSCRAGACGACKLRVLEGQVDPVGEALTASERSAGYVLSCIARPVGAVTLASGGRPPAGTPRKTIAAYDDLPAAKRRGVGRTRAVALVGASALLLGAWTLTDHRPASWDTVQASSPSAQPSITAPLSGTAGSSPSATSGHSGTGGTGGGSKATPTATRGSGGGSGGGGAAPTSTATPIVQPKPTPTATATPSKHV